MYPKYPKYIKLNFGFENKPNVILALIFTKNDKLHRSIDTQY